MEAVFKIRGEEFTSDFIQTIKYILSTKQNLELTVAITDPKSEGFLRRESREEYFNRLDTAIANLNKGHAVTFTMDEYENFTRSILNEP